MKLHKVVQLSHAPELNSVEHLFRDLRRALEPILNACPTDPERVKHLYGWCWIQDTLEALPTADATCWIGVTPFPFLLQAT